MTTYGIIIMALSSISAALIIINYILWKRANNALQVITDTKYANQQLTDILRDKDADISALENEVRILKLIDGACYGDTEEPKEATVEMTSDELWDCFSETIRRRDKGSNHATKANMQTSQPIQSSGLDHREGRQVRHRRLHRQTH